MPQAAETSFENIRGDYNDLYFVVDNYDIPDKAKEAITLGIIADLSIEYIEGVLNRNLDEEDDYDVKDIKSIREEHKDLILDFSHTDRDKREEFVEGLEERFGVGFQALYEDFNNFVEKVKGEKNSKYVDEQKFKMALKKEVRRIQKAYNVADGRADPYQVMTEEEAKNSLERAKGEASERAAQLRRSNIDGIENQRNLSMEWEVEEALVEVARALEKTGTDAEVGEGVATALDELEDRYDDGVGKDIASALDELENREDDAGMPLMEWEVQRIEEALERSSD